MDALLLERLPTPCIVADAGIVRRNIERMQRAADQAGCRLRPHIKTHKSKRFAKWQMETGCAGITCAKVTEAEIMADAGAEDVFIAYPAIGQERVTRMLALNRRIRRLILSVDSEEAAAYLNARAREAGQVFEVRLEVDTGLKRTGVSVEDAPRVARIIRSLHSLRLTGIYTYKGLSFHGAPTLDADIAAREEGEMLHRVAQMMRDEGAQGLEVSAGSTPTGLKVARVQGVTEIRPGTYIFNDYTSMRQGAARYEDVAAKIYATVVSVKGDYAVIDGGSKTFPTDIGLNAAPYHFDSYAYCPGREDLKLQRMNEEHGILTSTRGRVDLAVGQVLELIPLHICPAVNLQNELLLLEQGRLTPMPVDARGMLL